MFGKIVFAVALLASSASLWAENGMKTFKLSQDMFAVKAGTLITFEVEFESDPGYILAGWSAGVIRKNAPKEFFAKPEVKIKPHRHPDYSSIALVDYQHFPVAQTKGRIPVRINTAGMPVGDYAISVQGRWMKDNISSYPGSQLFLTITEADDAKFAATGQDMPSEFKKPRVANPVPNWCKNLVVTPNPVKVKSGTKIAFSCDYEAKDDEFYGGFLVLTLRKYTPQAFFEKNAAQVRKHASAPAYDHLVLVPFKHSPDSKTAKIEFELDTTGYPPGDYDIALQIRVVKADRKTSYPNYLITLTVTE